MKAASLLFLLLPLLAGCISAPIQTMAVERIVDSPPPQACLFDQPGFSCLNFSVAEDGKLWLLISNSNQDGYAMVVKGIACTAGKSPRAPEQGRQLGSPIVVKPGQSLGTSSFPQGVYCTAEDGSAFAPSEGAGFSGRVWVFYNFEQDEEGYPLRQASASVIE